VLAKLELRNRAEAAVYAVSIRRSWAGQRAVRAQREPAL